MQTSEKIKSREELVRICELCRKNKKRIGFTSGVFDIIHAGHVDYLEKAKGTCDTLIVGVNSDRSVKRFKGRNRPLIPEGERVKVLAGLSSVDYCFVFNERRNRKNIELLKPDLYIKAGDYREFELTSKQVVERIGGTVKLIKKNFDISTSDIIARIENFPQADEEHSRQRAEEEAVSFPEKRLKPGCAIFLDRDGTINEEVEYLHEPDKFKLLPNTIEAIKKMQNMGFRIIVITNQAGIGLGYFTKEDFFMVNRKMLKELSSAGITISKIYFCPHRKDEQCECRKPGAALIKRAARELNIDIQRSYVIGDQTCDIGAGENAGARTILLRTGFGGEDKNYRVKPDYVADDLLDAANYILKGEQC